MFPHAALTPLTAVTQALPPSPFCTGDRACGLGQVLGDEGAGDFGLLLCDAVIGGRRPGLAGLSSLKLILRQPETAAAPWHRCPAVPFPDLASAVPHLAPPPCALLPPRTAPACAGPATALQEERVGASPPNNISFY